MITNNNQIYNNKNDIRKLYEITDRLQMANFCNEYFVNIRIEMDQAVPLPQMDCPMGAPTPNSIYLTLVTRNEIIKHISPLRTRSAPGCDGIQVDTLKNTHLEILDPLLHIFNLIKRKVGLYQLSSRYQS